MLPLVATIFLLSRWAGGLVAKHGPTLPLVAGPFIVASGYALLARPGVGGTYWKTYFPAMVVLGLGMTVSVAPLTTVVMSSIGQRKAGTAAGINNAFSQTAALLALAICAPLFYSTFSHSLTVNLGKAGLSTQIIEQTENQKSRLGAAQTQQVSAKAAVDNSFVTAFRLVTLLAGLSATAAGLTAAFTIREEALPSQK